MTEVIEIPDGLNSEHQKRIARREQHFAYGLRILKSDMFAEAMVRIAKVLKSCGFDFWKDKDNLIEWEADFHGLLRLSTRTDGYFYHVLTTWKVPFNDKLRLHVDVLKSRETGEMKIQCSLGDMLDFRLEDEAESRAIHHLLQEIRAINGWE